MTEQFKRNIAYKLRIGDILLAKPIFDQDKFLYLELGERKISRINIVGNIIDKYESEGDKKYMFFTFDDGSGQIKLKVFGEDTEKFKGIIQGQTVVLIGVTRNWNNETYIQPEIMKEIDSKYLLVRKLELEKNRNTQAKPIEDKKEIKAIKDQILDSIKESEKEGGIDTDQIIMKFRNVSTDVINEEIKKLLEEGIIFEPRPSRLRYLG
jgi:RPA family protein